MRVYKNIEEIKELLGDVKVYEAEEVWIVEGKDGVSFLPKPLKKEKVFEILVGNGFPEKYLKVVLNGVKETEALKKVKETRKKGIILDGKPGVGKSIACTWKIAKLLQYRKVSNPAYISCVAFPDLKTLYSTYNEYDAYLIDDLITAIPQARLELIQEILYFAELKERYLFITSNNLTEFAKALPEALLSRLRSYCEFIKIREERDFRVQSLLANKEQSNHHKV